MTPEEEREIRAALVAATRRVRVEALRDAADVAQEEFAACWHASAMAAANAAKRIRDKLNTLADEIEGER